MTLLQISVTRDRALIATDTTCYSSDQGAPGADVYRWGDGEPVHVTKLHLVLAGRAVLTGRGLSSVRQYAAEQITHARDFEHAVDLLSRALPKLPALPGTYKGEPLRHTVSLIGWSEQHGCMSLATFESGDAYTARVQRATSVSGWFASLGPAATTKRPAWIGDPQQVEAHQAELAAYLQSERERDARCIESAAAYARLAVEQAREGDPAAPYGGRLLVAELTRDALRIVDAGDLGLPPRRPGAADLITTLQPGLVTACINPGAATDAYADETGADSVTIPGTGGSSFTTCASRTYTNALSGPVILQWDAEVIGLHFSAGATLASPDDYCSGSWVLKVNGTPVLSDAFIDTSVDLLPPDAGSQKSRSVGWQYALGVGDTAEIYLSVGGATDTNAATISWARTRLRTTVIKR